ncbi:MAG: topoisomerase DNA-binding C4 zinc finger domain-containing protein [Deltaproteobacteria bacterium]|nr:topoisomerase DNA-binding C4 zinc finger domain-containing protein [Deltaproteobacteria bacterium]
MEDTVIYIFDDILSRHMERLVGTRSGVGGLPVSVEALSCIILINDRVGSGVDGSPILLEDYTKDMLFNELEEMGFYSGERLTVTLHDMVDKGYVGFDDTDRILVKKPIVTMAQVLDRIYPTMPGLNFIAYLSQTLAEAQSGRKDQNFAADQLDQVLSMHGVALRRKRPSHRRAETACQDAPERSVKHTASPRGIPQKDEGGKVIKASDVRVSPRSLPLQPMADPSPAGSGAVPSEEKPREGEEINNGNAVSPFLPSPPSSAEENGPVPFVSGSEVVDSDMIMPRKDADSIDAPFRGVTDCGDERDRHDGEAVLAPHNAGDTPEEYPSSIVAIVPGDTGGGESEHNVADEERHVISISEEYVSSLEKSIDADGNIELQIAAFEDGLVMKCPLCKEGNVQIHETSAGRKYYVCSQKNCEFISWGKPFHRSCPDCGNNFLVEVVSKGGARVLKCPRATCCFRQRYPSESMRDGETYGTERPGETGPRLVAAARRQRKKVVRRKVVRKRSA